MELQNFFSLALTSFVLSITAIVLIRPIAIKIGLIDHPCERKRHNDTVPLVGGLAVYGATLLALTAYGEAIPGFAGFAIAMTSLVLIGIYDDYLGMKVRWRIVIQAIAGLLVIGFAGVTIAGLGYLLVPWFTIQLGWLALPFTLFALIGNINAFNMIDGIDGLAGSVAVITLALLAALCYFYGRYASCQLSIALLAATIGFLLFNLRIFGRQQAVIFLGDIGSTLLGFVIGWLVIDITQGEQAIIAPVTALWILAVPILDTFSVMIRRIEKGRSPFAPDREHFHHTLLHAGYSANQTLAIIALLSLFLALFGLVCDLLLDVPQWIMFYLFLMLFACYFLAVKHAWKTTKLMRRLHSGSAEEKPE